MKIDTVNDIAFFTIENEKEILDVKIKRKNKKYRKNEKQRRNDFS